MSVKYNDKLALGIDGKIEIKDGERVGIIGSNGAGKTTLIKSILGLVDYSGTISTDIDARKIAVHMQQNEYADTVPVRIIIEMVVGHSIKSDPILSDMIEFFEFEDCLNKKWKHLSGGQKQRLTLILVLCQDSPITMFDEVTSGLDFETRQRLMDMLERWFSGRDTTLLITSHYYAELDSLATKILFLDKGHVIDYGSKEELFDKYCGKSVFIFDDSENARQISESHRTIVAPPGKIAIACDSLSEEGEVSAKLIESNINYRRSNNDIEVMSLNAKSVYELSLKEGR